MNLYLGDWTDWMQWPLGLVLLWIGYHATLFITVLVQVLRVPIFPTQLVLAEVSDRAREALSAPQAAWLQEVEALGFVLRFEGVMIDAGGQFPVAVLRHVDEPVWASVTFRASLLQGYLTSFDSVLPDGSSYSTRNRLGWLSLTELPQHRTQDVYVSNLTEQWTAHRQWAPAVADQEDPEAIRAWMVVRCDSGFEALRSSGKIKLTGGHWHFSGQAALRAALAWRGVRKLLARPLDSVALQGDRLPAFLAECYEGHERLLTLRPPRHSVKAGLLVGSLVVSLVLWGVSFSWPQALMITAILLVHELGHALMMRRFGWKDMNMFFIPFIGAMVTGRPGRIPAAQQCLVLLAGPLPGLLAGLALLWWAPELSARSVHVYELGLMAVTINLFNLLPLAQLDGGQLLGLALFSRWPRSRVAFAGLGTLGLLGLAAWLQSELTALLALLSGLGVWGQWRMARLQELLPGLGSGREQLTRLFEAARQQQPRQTPARWFATARAVLAHQQAEPPRLWLSAAVVSGMLLLWAGGGWLIWESFGQRHAPRSSAATPAPSPSQVAFDQAWFELDEVRGEDTDSAEVRQRLRDAGQVLETGDPRRVDLAFSEIDRLPAGERAVQLDAFLRAGQNGHHTRVEQVLAEALSDIALRSLDDPPAERLRQLSQALAWAEEVVPTATAERITLQLWLAEARDQAGQTPQAEAQLDGLLAQVRQADDRPAQTIEVLRAQVWFRLSHQRAADAVALIDRESRGPQGEAVRQALAVDKAWALLMDSQAEAGRAQMWAATTAPPPAASSTGWLLRLLQRSGSAPGVPRLPADMAHAYLQAGQPEQARALLAQPRARWLCLGARNMAEAPRRQAPWQGLREDGRRRALLEACPAAVARQG